MSTPFIGQIIAVAFKTVPPNWAACDGSLLPISGYQALFALLGTRYGGDGQSTFALPNLNGRVPVGQGQGRGLPAYSVGDSGGAETVTLVGNQSGAHTHVLQATTSAGNATVPTAAALAQNTQTQLNMYAVDTPTAPAPADTPLSPNSIAPWKGGFQPHENRQPFGVVNYIIALQGVFPSQT